MWCTARFWNNLLQARSNDFNKKYFYCLIKVLLGKKHEFCHYNKVLKIIFVTTETQQFSVISWWSVLFVEGTGENH
jgi:hypothetical protein